MNTLESRSRAAWLYAAIVLLCLLGLVTSLIPGVSWSDPFWGVSSFADKEPFDAGNSPGVVILSVEADSPAAAAQLRGGDKIASINGRDARFATFREQLAELQTGQVVTLDGWRNEEELHLRYTAPPRKLEGVLVLDWQFATAPLLLVLLLIMIATQPLDWPLWRSIVVMLSGLLVMAATALVETLARAKPWTILWQSQAISHGYWHMLRYVLAGLALITGLALSFLGALSIRGTLMRREAARAESRAN